MFNFNDFKQSIGLIALAFILSLSAFAYSSTAKGEVAVTAPKVQKTVVLSSANTVFLNGYVGSKSMAQLQQQIMTMDAKMMPKSPIYLVINSGGGSIQAGLEMFDFARSINRPIHTISIWAASMGFHMAQNMGDRYVVENGTLMSHKARGGFRGEFPGQLDSRYQRYLQRITSMNQKVVDRTNGKYTLAQYDELVENEYWCDGQTCVDAGFVDGVIKASCDSSLKGVRKEVFRRILRQNSRSVNSVNDITVIEVVDHYSKCPLITGYLGWNVEINGESLFSATRSMGTDALNNSVVRSDPEIAAAVQDYINFRAKTSAREVRLLP